MQFPDAATRETLPSARQGVRELHDHGVGEPLPASENLF